MPLFFLGTREWRNRQTRTVQVRVPVMEWGFNSPLAHDETADPLRICGFCFPWLWRRCRLSPRWCSGRRMCRAGLLCAPVGCGPPAREARQPHFVRRRASKPARALRSLRRPPHPWGRAAPWAAARPRAVRAASLRLGASPRIPARPRHRPRAPQQIPSAPSTPAALCRWSVAGCVGSKPGQAPCLEAFPILSFACNSLTPAVRHLVKSPEFQRLHFKA